MTRMFYAYKINCTAVLQSQHMHNYYCLPNSFAEHTHRTAPVYAVMQNNLHYFAMKCMSHVFMGYNDLSYACMHAGQLPCVHPSHICYKYAISAPHMVLFTGPSKYNVVYKGKMYMPMHTRTKYNQNVCDLEA